MRHREYPNLPHPLLGAFTNYVQIDIDSIHPVTTDLGFGNWTASKCQWNTRASGSVGGRKDHSPLGSPDILTIF
jgi:hypothetical protein